MPQGTIFRVNTITGNSTAPSAAMNGDGDLVVTWQDDGIMAQRYNAAGVRQGSPWRVNSNTTGSKSEPSAAIDAAGNFVVAWGSTAQDGSGSGVYAQRFTAFSTANSVTVAAGRGSGLSSRSS